MTSRHNKRIELIIRLDSGSGLSGHIKSPIPKNASCYRSYLYSVHPTHLRCLYSETRLVLSTSLAECPPRLKRSLSLATLLRLGNLTCCTLRPIAGPPPITVSLQKTMVSALVHLAFSLLVSLMLLSRVRTFLTN